MQQKKVTIAVDKNNQIIIRKTPNIRAVIDIYKQNKSNAIAQQSNNKEEQQQKHTVSTFKSLDVDKNFLERWSVLYPKQLIHGIQGGNDIEKTARLIEELISNKNGLDKKSPEYADITYLLQVFHQCRLYINDNQSRTLGAHALDIIISPKITAMLLLAHLCYMGIQESDHKETRTTYIKRIKKDSALYLQLPFITKSSSNDSSTLSCQSALVAIYHLQPKQAIDDNAMKAYQNNISACVTSAQNYVHAINNYIMPILSLDAEFSTVHQNKESNNVINALYEENKTIADKNYKILFTGISYNLDQFKEQFPFNIIATDTAMRDNLVRLLQLRDKLCVIQRELDDVHKQYKEVPHHFFHLTKPYLFECNQVQIQLAHCVATFKDHLKTIYDRRAQQKNENFEKIYTDSLSHHKFETASRAHGILALYVNTVIHSMSTLTIDFIASIQSEKEEKNEILQRSNVLFNIHQEPLQQANEKSANINITQEIERQKTEAIKHLQAIAEHYKKLLDNTPQDNNALGEELNNNIKNIEKLIQLITQNTCKLENTQNQQSNTQTQDLGSFITPQEMEAEVQEASRGFVGFFRKIFGAQDTPKHETTDYKQVAITLMGEVENLKQKNQELENTNQLLTEKNNTLTLQNQTLQEGVQNLQQANKKQTKDTLLLKQKKVLVELVTKTYTQYKYNSKQHDNKFKNHHLFSDSSVKLAHNTRGHADAKKRMGNILFAIQTKSGTNIQELLWDAIKAVKQTILDNSYSGYKTHSFRRYLHALHTELLDQYKNNSLLNDQAVQNFTNKLNFGNTDVSQTMRALQKTWRISQGELSQETLPWDKDVSNRTEMK